MWRKKKFIISLVVIAIAVFASIGGIAFAQGSGTDSQSDSLLGKVASILGIDQQKVEDAFTQAQQEMQQERQDQMLQNLVDQGILTEDQATQYKDWLNSKPDMSDYNAQMQQWFASKPDLPAGANLPGLGSFQGRAGMRGFGFGERSLPAK